MDEKQPIALESKNIIYDEPEEEGGAGAEGGEGKKEKKRITPLRVVLIVFCALFLVAGGILSAILVPELIIDNSEYSKTIDGTLVFYAADPEKLDENGSYTIKDTYFGMPVVAIRDGAFAGMDSLRSVTIPDTVTEIGAGAFSGCYNLEQIDLPASLLEIGDNAFNSCSKLTEIILPEGLESLGSRAFFGCKDLRRITIPSTLQYISEGAFLNCKSLATFVMEKESEFFTLDSYGNLYSYDEKNLIRYLPASGIASYTIPSHTTRILAYAFDGATNLIMLHLHDQVFMIEHDAFSNCEQLTIHIPLPEGISLPWDISWNSSGCKVVYESEVLPPDEDDNTEKDPSDDEDNNTDQKPSDGEDIYSEGLAFTLSEDGTYYILSGIGTCTDSELVIPSEYNGLAVKEIGNYAFFEYSNLTSITIPNSVTSIGEYAFQFCLGLTSVTVGDCVSSIGASAFFGCTALQSITIPDSVTEIGSGAFSSCYALASVTIGSSVTELSNSMFSGCSELTSITIPSSVTKIGGYAFSNCSALKSIIIPISVTEIEAQAFSYCNSLIIHCEAASQPSGWDTEWSEASCSVNWGILLPDETTAHLIFTYDELEKTATVVGFTNENYHVTVPSIINGYTVVAIADNAFAGCGALKSITIAPSVKSIGMCAFLDCQNLITVTLTSGLEVIGQSAFERCSMLQSIELPDTVRSIKGMAFSECVALQSISIPSSVTELGSRAFYGCTFLSKIDFDATVTTEYTAESAVFAGAGTTDAGLLITIGKNARTIPAFLFSGFVGANVYAPGVTSVAFEEDSSLMVIGEYAFANLDALESITLPASVVNVSPFAFLGCTSLSTIEVGEGSTSLLSIDGSLYTQDASTLILYAPGKTSAFTVPSSVSAISPYAFYAHEHLEVITIPESVTIIYESAFEDCSRLCVVSFASALREIGKNAFAGCSTLSSVTIPDSVFTVGEHAFGGSTSLIIYCVAASKPNDWDNEWHDGTATVFWGVDEGFVFPDESSAYLTYAFDDATMTATVTGCTARPSHITIPSAVDGYAVVAIGDNAFSGCDTMTSITIPSSITSIGISAFHNCRSLEGITLPGSLTKIDAQAFYNCYKITSITIPSSVTEIGSEAFYNCSALTSVTLPDSITTISDSLFAACDSLENIIIPSSVSAIGNSAFSGCYALSGIVIPDSVTSIGERAFMNCSRFTSFTIPGSVSAIGKEAFAYCTNLVSLTLGGSVASIGEGAFFCCYKLVEIINHSFLILTTGTNDYGQVARYAKEIHNAQSKIESVGDYLFYTYNDIHYLLGYIGSDTALALPDGYNGQNYEIYQYALYAREDLLSISFPDFVTRIGNNAFDSCKGLIQISLSGSITEIGRYAFQHCSALTSVAIPDSVTQLGWSAFSGCSALTSVTGGGSLVSIGDYAFGNCSELSIFTIIPDSVTEIGYDAFSGCQKLMVKENGIYYVGDWVIDSDSDITVANLRAGTRKIADYAFRGCTALRTVLIPQSVLVIGYNICEGCTDLTFCVERESQPSGWSHYWNYAKHSVVWDCVLPDESSEHLSYTFDDINMTATVTDYTGSYTHVTIPTVVNGYTVTAIGNTAFDNIKNLTGVTLPATITSIGSSAFAGCPSLISITLPPALTSIGDYAFSGCETLVEVINLSTLRLFIGDDSYGKVAAYALEIHSGESEIVRVGDYLFYTFGETNYLVGYAGTDTVLTLPEGYNGEGYEIYRYAFAERINITSVTVPDAVSAIGDGAFTNCYALTSVQLGSGILSIGNEAFAACGELASINMPAALKIIGNNAFWACDITSIVLPDTVTEIGDYAFSSCSELTSVTLGSSLAKIGAYAFEGCTKLPMIVIPRSVSALGARVFSGCSALSIYCEAESQPTGWSASFNPGGCPIVWAYVAPDESSAYLTYTFDDTNKTATVTGYTGELSHVTIPSAVDGYTVVSIGYAAFQYCEVLESITIPPSVTFIDGHAFQGCSALASITIPDSVTEIGYFTFQSCYALSSVTLGNSITSIGTLAFNGCSSLRSIALPDSLISIGDSAFYACSGLTSITIPSSVTSISSYAFYGCSSLSSVTIGSSVISIGEYAFDSCYKLIEIINHSSLNITAGSADHGYVAYYAKDVHSEESKLAVVDNYLFYTAGGVNYLLGYAGNDTDLVLPDSYNGQSYEIYPHAFDNDHSLTSIIIPDAVSAIGEYAFYWCPSLTSVSLGNSGRSIGDWAFAYCSVLEAFPLPDSLSRIGEFAFEGCSNIVVIHNGISYVDKWVVDCASYVTTPSLRDDTKGIADAAFSGCSGMTSIIIPASVSSIGYGVFDGCSGLASITVTNGNTMYKSTDGNLYSIDDKILVQYAAGKSDASFDIPNSVTEIGDYAFSSCSSLTSITIPDSVISIGEWAFYNCSNLTGIIIPSSVNEIGENAFYNCSNLTIYCEAESQPSGWNSNWNDSNCPVVWGAILPDESSAYLTYSYNDATMTATVTDYTGDYTTVTVPTLVNGYKVVIIGEEAFRGCSKVTEITLPSTITSIGTRAFFACTKLTSITIGASVTWIGEYAFNNCGSLSEITVADGNTVYKSIDGNLYSLDESTLIQYAVGKTATDFTVPNTVQEIGDYAFSNSQSLVRVTIPDSVTTIGSAAFYNCRKLQHVSLGNSLRTIKSSAFSICQELSAITLPETLERIENNAFSSCEGLSTISIPDSVTFIGDSAFTYCTSLTSVTIGSGVSEIGSMVFVDCASLSSITVDSDNSFYCDIDGNLYSKDGITLIQYATAKTDTSFTVPDSVTVIGEYAFSRSDNLTSVTLSDSVHTICDNAFFDCENLETITLGAELTQIGHGALEAPNLSSILVDEDNLFYCDIDGNLYSKDGTTLVQYAIGKTDTYFVVADTVTSIGTYAFSGCLNLQSIIIPESVSYIGECAFISCVFLTINCEASEQPEGWDAKWNYGGCTVIWGEKLS